jgi:hypothetical protein
MKTSRSKLITILLVSMLATCPAWSQDELRPSPTLRKMSIGLSAGHYRYDPGVAVEFTTKAFLQNQLSIRVRGSVQWMEAYKAVYDRWASYRSFSAGLVYNGVISERARFFAEVGMLGIAPDNRFSDKRFIEGIYEFNGVEIIFVNREDYLLSFYFGLGPTFINSTAEKIEGNPRYGSGIHYINGIRIYF